MVVMYRRRTLEQQVQYRSNPYDLVAMKNLFTVEWVFFSKELGHYLGKFQVMAKKVLCELQSQGIVEMIGNSPAEVHNQWNTTSWTARVQCIRTLGSEGIVACVCTPSC